jgi:hypothetical protein
MSPVGAHSGPRKPPAWQIYGFTAWLRRLFLVEVRRDDFARLLARHHRHDLESHAEVAIVFEHPLLVRVPLFSHLGAAEIADIMRLLRAQTIESGEVLVRRGEQLRGGVDRQQWRSSGTGLHRAKHPAGHCIAAQRRCEVGRTPTARKRSV